MKRLIMPLMLCLVASLFCGCGGKVLDRPPEMSGGSDEVETLEFWVGEKAEEGAFDGHALIVGMFGGVEYFGSGYWPEELFTPGGGRIS